MNTLLHILIAVGFGLFYGIWRRCYGGLDSDLWKKIFGKKWGSALHRHFWRIVNLASIFSMMFFYVGTNWVWAAYTALIVQFLFWDWTFGMYMGIGRHPYPSEEDIKEYNEQFFAPFLNWFIDEKKRYGEFYDYLGMMFRFAAPGLFLFFVPSMNIGLCLLGMIIATEYLIWLRFIEKGYKNFIAVNFNELSAGFMTGFMLFI